MVTVGELRSWMHSPRRGPEALTTAAVTTSAGRVSSQHAGLPRHTILV